MSNITTLAWKQTHPRVEFPSARPTKAVLLGQRGEPSTARGEVARRRSEILMALGKCEKPVLKTSVWWRLRPKVDVLLSESGAFFASFFFVVSC